MGVGCASKAPPAVQRPGIVAEADDKPALVRLPLCAGHELVLLDEPSAAALISTRDAYIAAMTPLDRRLRAGKKAPVDDAAYLAFAREQARGFTPAQIEKLKGVASQVGDVLDALGFARWLPAEIQLGQTTGAEEGLSPSFDLSYTRSGVIYVNARAIDLLSRQLLLHELFHVMAATHPALRDALYRALGFEKVNVVDYPPEIEGVRMTMPEVLRAEYGIRVTHAGMPVLAIPIAASSVLEPQQPMIDVLMTRWVIVDQRGAAVALATEGELGGLAEQVGLNAPVQSGPEEILAENFVTLVLGTTPRSPDVIARMRALLAGP